MLERQGAFHPESEDSEIKSCEPLTQEDFDKARRTRAAGEEKREDSVKREF
jgi:hypothetical protein